MSVFIDKNTNVLVQGITGSAGSFQTEQMLQFGTNIVAGVTPGKQGENIEGVPVYNTIKEALRYHKIDWSVLFVPAPHVRDAAFEALNTNLNIVIISEGVPVHDAIEIIQFARKKKLQVLGPNCPGLAVVNQSKVGIMPNHIFKRGDVGVVSRSGTLTYEVIYQLTRAGIGQSACVGIGGDPCIGTNFIDVLRQFEHDPNTKQVVLIGEIGGTLEEQAAHYVHKEMSKPVVAYIAGSNAPQGKTMGHAGAITGMHGEGTAQHKIEAFKRFSIPIAKTPSGVVKLILKNKTY